jgi:hypothetical protein
LDFKELIPEIYYLPDIFLNLNNFEFGHTQTKDKVTDVVLPEWAMGDPRLFVNTMRKALESPIVSANLNNWIDLIFGYKQTGKPAIDALNVFYFLTYEGAINLMNITDPVERNSIIAQINEYGQTPRQLIRKAHPEKKKNEKSLALFTTPILLKNLVANQYGIVFSARDQLSKRERISGLRIKENLFEKYAQGEAGTGLAGILNYSLFRDSKDNSNSTGD